AASSGLLDGALRQLAVGILGVLLMLVIVVFIALHMLVIVFIVGIVAALALSADELAIDEVAPEPDELDGWRALDGRNAGESQAGLRDQNYGEDKSRYRQQCLHVVIPPVSAGAAGRLGKVRRRRRQAGRSARRASKASVV